MLLSMLLVLVLLILLISIDMIVCNEDVVAFFPLQMSSSLQITANLIDKDSDYPPRVRNMKIFYDYTNKRARIDIEEGYEARKTYIRRYDIDEEYMIRPSPIDDCKYSFLDEIMPYPDVPAVYVREETVKTINGDDVITNYYLFEEYDARIHVYMNKINGAPVRVIQEGEHDGQSIPLLTYDYYDVVLEEPNISLFTLPATYVKDDTCLNHLGGFPYQHIFHYFVRF